MFYTTLKKYREVFPSTKDWCKLLTHLGKKKADDDPLPIKTILDVNGLASAISAVTYSFTPEFTPETQLFAIRCVLQIKNIAKNERCLADLEIGERYAVGDATDEELDEARRLSVDEECLPEDPYEGVCGVGQERLYNMAECMAWHAAYSHRRFLVLLRRSLIYGEGFFVENPMVRSAIEKDFIDIFCGGN